MADNLFIHYTNTCGNLGYHQHEEDEIVLIRHGKMIVYTKKQAFLQESPCCILYKRNTLHRQSNTDIGKYERFCIQYSRQYLTELPIQDSFYLYLSDDAICIPMSAEEFSYIWTAAKKLYSMPSENAENSERQKLLFAWILKEMEYIYRKNEKMPVKEVTEHYLLSVMRYIGGHLNEKMTIDSIAEKFHIGRTKLTSDFRKYLAVSFNEYVTIQRLNAARDLLTKGNDYEDIAETCGFSDSMYLAKVFKKHIGVTPSQYYRAHGLGADIPPDPK